MAAKSERDAPLDAFSLQALTSGVTILNALSDFLEGHVRLVREETPDGTVRSWRIVPNHDRASDCWPGPLPE